MATSLRKLAKLAGVSDVTVLRALRGEENVRPKLRKQILELAKKHCYEPNLLTRGVFGKKTYNVAIIVPMLMQLHYSATVNGAINTLQAKGYRSFTIITEGNVETEFCEIQQASSRRVDGILMIASSEFAQAGHFQEIEKRNIPLVLMSRPVQKVPFTIVTGADRKDGYLLTKKLINYGHKKILHITHIIPEYPAEARRTNGWKDALSEQKIDFKPLLLNLAEHSKSDPVNIIVRKLKSEDGITAIFAASIGIVPIILKAIKKAKLTIPNDLSLATFLYGNPNDISRKLPPRISGIIGPSVEIGKQAATELIKLIDRKNKQNGSKKTTKLKIIEIQGKWFEGDTIRKI